jgi:hypothetical protein
MERAGNADAQGLRYYAQLYESASDPDVDVALGLKTPFWSLSTLIPKVSPVDPTATQIDTISSAEQRRAPIELDLATPSTFTAPTTTNDVTRAGASNG